MSALFAMALPYLITAGAAILTVLGIWAKGKAAGKKEIKDAQLREQVTAAQTRRKIEAGVDADSGDANREWLRKHSRRD